MSGQNSRSRSPSTGTNGRQHSSSFGQMGSQSLDPQMFNSSVYQAGAPFQGQTQFLSANGMSPGYSMQDQGFGNSFGDPFGQKNGGGMNGGLMVDPSLQGGDGSVNPTDLTMNNGMSPQDQMSPTSAMQGGLGSQQHSPHLQQGRPPLHPSSAGVGQGMLSEILSHRRSPSEQSDVSSVAHSPFQASADTFDDFGAQHSPLLNPTHDPSLYSDGIDLNQFTISDPRRASLSQRNSPYISPNLVPAPNNNGLGPDGTFVLPSNSLQQFPDADPNLGYEPNDMGQADMMAAPEINVELAPPQQPQVGGETNNDALSPPQRGRTIRNRAKSEASLGPGPMSRPLSPAELAPTLIPQSSLLDAGINQPQRHRSLSPFDATFPAHYRSSSPGSARSSRRSSTSSINPNRDYILELADPNRQAAAGSGHSGTRVQKHPATFQCTMCPKRFTRAYNLRSHLRTHTDERPFVCSVCGKAFARQHDRKRHEGLHSGEKKFVCKGELANGQGEWGCGRRFARADALGRHFRSEAGRVCIKPLLDEELAEKRRAYEQSVLAGAQMGAPGQMGTMPPGGLPPPPPGVLPSQGPGVDLGMAGGAGGAQGFSLPQAILVQYPALQGLQWDQLGNGPGAGPMDDDDGGLSGRSSFDATGEDEYDDGYASGSGMYGQRGWVSDQGGI